jgi:protein-tyrosine phosphatase
MAQTLKQILFVCLGNICRSPFAEGLFTKLAGQYRLDGMVAQSAGLIALPGNSATHMAQRVAAEHDVDLTAHSAQPVSEDLVSWSDLILVMEKSHSDSIVAQFPEETGKIQLIRHYARYGSKKRGIADPYGLDYEAYRFCFVDIEDAVSGLVAYLRGDKISR